MGLTFPGESAEYRAARDALLARERELRRTLEDVSIARRALPPGGAVPENYQFRERRLVSSSGNTFNREYNAESATGDQRPFLNVFRRVGSTITHFWGSELFDEPTEAGQDPRHVGTLEPSWNLLDLTPEGRPPAWGEQFTYPE